MPVGQSQPRALAFTEGDFPPCVIIFTRLLFTTLSGAASAGGLISNPKSYSKDRDYPMASRVCGENGAGQAGRLDSFTFGFPCFELQFVYGEYAASATTDAASYGEFSRGARFLSSTIALWNLVGRPPEECENTTAGSSEIFTGRSAFPDFAA